MAKSSDQSDRQQEARDTPGQPLILAADDDIEALRILTRELKQRYDADYEVVCERLPRRALETLEEARDGELEVALVLAGARPQAPERRLRGNRTTSGPHQAGRSAFRSLV